MTDFGIASLNAFGMTEADQDLVCTPQFTAPERLTPDVECDLKSCDVYSYAMTIYQVRCVGG